MNWMTYLLDHVTVQVPTSQVCHFRHFKANEANRRLHAVDESQYFVTNYCISQDCASFSAQIKDIFV